MIDSKYIINAKFSFYDKRSVLSPFRGTLSLPLPAQNLPPSFHANVHVLKTQSEALLTGYSNPQPVGPDTDAITIINPTLALRACSE